MDPLGIAAVVAGMVLVGLGLVDVFLTILHPDRAGILSARMARGLWRLALLLAPRAPAARREVLAFAGGATLAMTILVWVALLVAGFGLLVWPSMDVSYRLPPGMDPTIGTALYYAGVAFTTVGFGDITPTTPLHRLLAVVMGFSGFALMTAAITYILSISSGLDRRAGLSLRVHAETGGTGDGVRLVAHSLRHEGAPALARRLEGLAHELGHLEARLYRFQSLALYLRGRDPVQDLEPLLETLAEVSLAADLAAAAPEFAQARTAADSLRHGLAHVMDTISSRIAPGGARAMAEAPTDDDRARLRDVWLRLQGELEATLPPPHASAHALDQLARSRRFLDRLDGLTRWRALRPGAPERA